VIESSGEESVPEILNKAFLAVDSEVNQREGKFSGCTAIVAYIKVIEEKVIFIKNINWTKKKKKLKKKK
jgi:protein phosphatase PTC1